MKILSCVVSFFLCSVVFAQEWAPKGTEWYYDSFEAMSPNIFYATIVSDSVVSVKGKECKRLDVNCGINTHFCGQIDTYESNDTVFFLNPDIDTFQVLYNFNASKGDTWVISAKDSQGILDTIVVEVDSVGERVINGKTLKVLYVTYNQYFNTVYGVQNYQHSSEIVEQIGDLHYLFNIESKIGMVVDAGYRNYNLRCYIDSDLGHFNTGIRSECTDAITSVESETAYSSVAVFPNPAEDVLTIENVEEETVQYALMNVRGNVVLSGEGRVLDVSALPKGVYYLRFLEHGTNSKVLKVIKN